MTNLFHVSLPLPPRALSPNFRGHTRARAGAVAKYRRDVFYLLKVAKIPALPTPVVLHWDWHMSRPETLAERYARAGEYEPEDVYNATGAMKSAIDALQDAGVIPNDTYQYVRQGHCEFHSGTGKRCIVLSIEVPEAEMWSLNLRGNKARESNAS